MSEELGTAVITLMMDAVSSSETTVSVSQTTRRSSTVTVSFLNCSRSAAFVLSVDWIKCSAVTDMLSAFAAGLQCWVQHVSQFVCHGSELGHRIFGALQSRLPWERCSLRLQGVPTCLQMQSAVLTACSCASLVLFAYDY